MRRYGLPPGEDDLAEMAARVAERLPGPFRGPARAVAIRVADLAPPGVLADLGIDDAFDLTGLYEGIPLTEKSVFDQPAGPDVIWLYRRAIMEEWLERSDVTLEDLVAHVLVHEFAHHFGWSDDDIAAIDRWWE